MLRLFRAPRAPADDDGCVSELEALRRRNEELERELELHRKIRQVADQQHENICRLLTEQEQYSRLWQFTVDAMNQLRATLERTATQARLQLGRMESESDAGFSMASPLAVEGVQAGLRDETAPLHRSGIDPLDTVENVFERVSEQARELRNSLFYCATNTGLASVKLDHILWKTEIYQLLWIRSDRTSTEHLAGPNTKLHQWFHDGEGRARYRSYAAYRSLGKIIEETHALGLAALEKAFANDTVQCFSRLEQMETHSAHLLEALADLNQEAKPLRHNTQGASSAG